MSAAAAATPSPSAAPAASSAAPAAVATGAKSAVPQTPQFDLTQTLAAFLDKHMVLPMLDFVLEKKLYAPKDLLAAKIALAAQTKMIDFHAGEYRALHGQDPANLEANKAAVYAELQASQTALGPLLAILNDENHVAEELHKDGRFTLTELAQSHGVTRENVEALYTFAKLNFDCGRYRDSGDYLYYYRLLVPAGGEKSGASLEDSEKNFQALWGKLASEILMVNGDAAYNDLMTLKSEIDARTHIPPYLQLQQRSWLLHWALFVFFNQPDGRIKLIEFMMGDSKLLNAIQTSCPHLLRYLTVSVVINRKSVRVSPINQNKNILRDLTRILQTEANTYTDPVIQFLLAVYIDFDFQGAHAHLARAEGLLQNDFFLGYSTDEFMEQARLLLFEAYTKIHKIIQIDTLAKVLDLASPSVFPSAEYKERKLLEENYAAEVAAAAASGTAAPPRPAELDKPLPSPPTDGSGAVSLESVVESKLVELIRVCRVDARIDASARRILIASEPPALYQQIIDRTKSITYRSTQLVHVIDKKIAQRNGNMEAQD